MRYVGVVDLRTNGEQRDTWFRSHCCTVQHRSEAAAGRCMAQAVRRRLAIYASRYGDKSAAPIAVEGFVQVAP